MGKGIDPKNVDVKVGSAYPDEYASLVAGRLKRALGDAVGLTQFGVNLVVLPPACPSTQRHWHSHEDEFIIVLEGEVVLILDEGEQLLTTGMCAGFKAGNENGHQLVNRTNAPATYLEVGGRHEDDFVGYSEIDLKAEMRNGKRSFFRKDGSNI
jgi:uncharacterized cupin superfamily protein